MKTVKKIFKIDAMGDTVYVNAATEPEAIDRLTAMMGEIPSRLLTITVVDALPDDEEFL